MGVRSVKENIDIDASRVLRYTSISTHLETWDILGGSRLCRRLWTNAGKLRVRYPCVPILTFNRNKHCTQSDTYAVLQKYEIVDLCTLRIAICEYPNACCKTWTRSIN